MTPDFLMQMAWKSALLVLAGLALVLLMRHRPAAERSLVLRLTVLLLLLLPVAALFGPRLAVEQPDLLTGLATAPALPAAPTATPVARPLQDMQPLPVEASFPWQPVLIALYGLGVGIILSRLAAGIWTLRRWTQAAKPLIHPLWGAAYDRALLRSGVRRRKVALLLSRQTPSPLGWGLRRPAILIDPATAARDEQAEAVLAHEMAHVARGDWLMLIASRLALALFWFNPLVWLLDRRLSEQAEEAADMHAVSRVDPAAYAQTLLNCVALPAGQALPATPMVARSGLGRRILTVLDEGARTRAAASGSVWTALACAAIIASATAIAALELLPAKPAMAAAIPLPAVAVTPALQPAAPVATPSPTPAAAPVAPVQPLGPIVAEAVADQNVVDQNDASDWPAPPAPPAPPAAPSPPAMPAMADVPPPPPAPPSPPAPSRLSHVRVMVPSRPAVLQQMGVTPAYVAAISGAFGTRIDEHEAMALKTLGVTADCVRDWRAAGLSSLSVDDATQLAALGIKPDFIQGMLRAGLGQLSIDELVELRAVGVTPEFAAKARRAGHAESVDDLVEYRVAGWR